MLRRVARMGTAEAVTTMKDNDYRRRCTCSRNATGVAAAAADARWPKSSDKEGEVKDAPWKA